MGNLRVSVVGVELDLFCSLHVSGFDGWEYGVVDWDVMFTVESVLCHCRLV